MNQQTSGDIADHERDQQSRVDGMLRTNWFNRVSSFPTSQMLILGTLLSVLLLVWIQLQRPSEMDRTQPERMSWASFKPEGLEHDFWELGADQIVDLAEPNTQNSLLAVTKVAASSDNSLINQPSRQHQNSDGDSRPLETDGADNLISRFEHWQLNFSEEELDSCTPHLDHCVMEIGLLGSRTQGVEHATSLSSQRTTVRRRASSDEKRLYLLWTEAGPLMRYDRQLLRRTFDFSSSNISVENRQILKFTSEGLENQLAKLELEYARGKGRETLDSIAKTVVIGAPQGAGYQFVVGAQRYRKPKD